MTRRSVLVSSFAIAVVCASPLAARAQDPPLEPAAVEAPAHVSVVEGTVLLERDGAVDDSPANMPLLAGDRVRTRDGRAEILFNDGGTLHLDAHTTVDFQSDDLVRLLEGRVRLNIPGPLRAVSYRVDAPAGWAHITQPGEYRISMLRGPRGEELELAVLRGGAELATEAGRTPLRAGERAFAAANAAPSYAYVFNSASWDAFDRWSEGLRDQRLGASAQYLPDEVRPYATSFDRYGTWRHDVNYGYVWYPTVAVDWRPYYHGRWLRLRPYGWTWIGADPWAWPTHHYGRWGISAGVWFWIPGRTWGPAWVSWAYAGDYIAWSPLGWNNRPLIQINLFTGRDRWHPWTFVPRRHFGYGYVHRRAVRYTDIDVRIRGSFASRHTGPDFRGYAVPRATAPIRVAGTRTGRAIPRGSTPSTVYTNLERNTSRVGQGGRRVMVPASPPSAAGSRAASPATATRDADRSRAVTRGAAPGTRAGSSPQRSRSGVQAQPTTGIARPRYEPSTPGVTRAPVSPRATAPADSRDDRRQRTPRYGAPAGASSGRAIRRGDDRAAGTAPGIRATPPAPGSAPSPPSGVRRATPPAPGSAPSYRSPGVRRATPPAAGSAPSYRSPGERRAPQPSGSRPPSGVRAVPRGGGNAPPPSAPARIERRGPAPSQPSRPGASAPGRRGGSEPGSRPRGGGQPGRSRAVPRGGGGV